MLYKEKIKFTGVFLRVKDPDDPKRPDPIGSGSGSATLIVTVQ